MLVEERVTRRSRSRLLGLVNWDWRAVVDGVGVEVPGEPRGVEDGKEDGPVVGPLHQVDLPGGVRVASREQPPLLGVAGCVCDDLRVEGVADDLHQL